mmetsp:Transcript_82911/g.238287  ORF Transcript_82911/g.238287 Transcript_82911/m.238287 type:complete len:437 (+) Transcript_82911:137-1447(+)
MLQDLGLFQRGFVAGSCAIALVSLLVWTSVLLLQVLQAHRIPVQTTQLRPLERFPETGFVVVSKVCTEGPPFSNGSPGPPDPPVFDFASVADFTVGDDQEGIVDLRRPDPASILWRQHRYVDARYGRRGNFTCAFTVAGFAEHGGTECFHRASSEDTWYSAHGWHACHGDVKRFDPLIGLSVGNWSTVDNLAKQAKNRIQLLPSWPSETFFLLPVVGTRLESFVQRMDNVIQEAVQKELNYAETALNMQDELSTHFPDGVWLFQAFNSDPFANIGPSLVRLRSSRCEGECEAGTTQQTLSATLEKAPPKWRQPLCSTDMHHVSEHQSCVPIVFVVDTREAVVISTVAFRWPNLFAQWASPLVVFALLLPVVLLVPCLSGRAESGSVYEGHGLMGSKGLDGSGGSGARRADDGFEGDGTALASMMGLSRVPQLDDDV